MNQPLNCFRCAIAYALCATLYLPQLAIADNEPTEAHEDHQLYTCGMHPQVVQDHPGTCPICHMKLTPLKDSGADTIGGTEGKKERRIKYYWDPMLGPSSISDKPGKSAMGMDLVPVYEDEGDAGPGVRIDARVVQNMGIRTAPVIEAPLTKSIRAVGVLSLPEPGLRDVSLKVNGWIEKLYADSEGKYVKKGDPLFELYSPDLQVAEEEFIAALKVSGNSQQMFLETARQKLRFLDLSDSDIDALSKSNRAPRTTIFRSPANGHIEEKMVVEGSSVQQGMKLFRIADHSTMWLELQVYSEDISTVREGQEVEATVEGVSERTFIGQIAFIYPHLDPISRSIKLRVLLKNPDFELKPGMYASGFLKSNVSPKAILVPRESVIDTGDKQIAFVVEKEGTFLPRSVRIGVTGDDDRVQILSGLSPGEIVVTSGQFLLDVESRTTEAIQKLRAIKSSSSNKGDTK